MHQLARLVLFVFALVTASTALAQTPQVLTPLAAGQATGGEYFPMQFAFDAQPTLNSSGQPVGGSGGQDAPYYASRVGYIDFGPDWANVRISATWTRYRASSVGNQTPYESLWWDMDMNTTNDLNLTETRLNFNTAQGLSTGSLEPWIQDRDLSAAPVAPRARYLLCRAPAVMTNRAKEYAIIGWRTGTPQNTFTIPYPTNGNILYLPNIQAAYPAVDWSTLDRLYISAGTYAAIKIGNLPTRSAARPLVITNKGGQVRVGGFKNYYLFTLDGGSNWVLTGEYDAAAQTGDANFPGHKGNNYANTRGTYGFLIDDDFFVYTSSSGIKSALTGLSIGGKATDFEVSYVEIREVSFAGLMMKTDRDGTAVMRNVRLHDLYIHDTLSEGFYIGSTQVPPQHAVENLEIDNCRVLRTGTEALQLGQLGTGTHVHHNVFALGAMDWKNAFETSQDSNSQIGVRYGQGSIHHNIFIGAANSLISFFAQVRSDDPHATGDQLTLHDNYYDAFRFLGAYVGIDQFNSSPSDGVTSYRFERNFFRGFSWQRAEVYSSATQPTHLFRIAVTQNPVVLNDNRFDTNVDLTNRFAGVNGSLGNVVASGNTRGVVDPVAFNNFGFPTGFDYLRVEVWTATCGRCSSPSTPVYYQPDDYVMHKGVLYRNVSGVAVTGTEPGTAPTVWSNLGFPPDDVRLAPTSPYQGLGLMDRVP
jgi:hypothetical protein